MRKDRTGQPSKGYNVPEDKWFHSHSAHVAQHDFHIVMLPRPIEQRTGSSNESAA
jgi:hypothetical protein